jgi:fumarate reductase subunit D
MKKAHLSPVTSLLMSLSLALGILVSQARGDHMSGFPSTPLVFLSGLLVGLTIHWLLVLLKRVRHVRLELENVRVELELGAEAAEAPQELKARDASNPAGLEGRAHSKVNK